MAPADRSPTSRGQSAVDFVIGFGVFFVTLTFVLVFIPDLLSPFGAQEGPAVADRAVETLTSDLLAAGSVATLDPTCTEEFFAESGTSCAFDGNDPVPTILGVSNEYQFNVTVEQNATADPGLEVVCYDGSSVVACPNTTRLARGPAPPGDTQSVRTARRVVSIDGETAFVKLRVW